MEDFILGALSLANNQSPNQERENMAGGGSSWWSYHRILGDALGRTTSYLASYSPRSKVIQALGHVLRLN